MSVHYKFKSTLDFDTITFDGLYISVGDLKKEILLQKRLGKLTDFDLQVTNAQTKEEYNEESCLIPKNTSLIIARIPLTQPKKTWNTEVEKTTQNRVTTRSDGGSLDLSKMEGSEEDKINAMMMQSTVDYDPKSYQRLKGHSQTGEVPPTYRCNRCKRTGHWIKNCTFNGNKEHTEVKRNTGIPRSFLEKSSEEKLKNEITPPPAEMEKEEIPEDLICVICNDLFTDAVMIPCCGSSFCDDCVRTALLESEENECPDCKEKNCSPESLIPNRFLRNSVNVFKNETGYKAAPVKKVVNKVEPPIKAASPEHITESIKSNEKEIEENSIVNKEKDVVVEKDKDIVEPKDIEKKDGNNGAVAPKLATDSKSNAKELVTPLPPKVPILKAVPAELIVPETKTTESPNFEETESDYEDNITVTVPIAQTEAQRAAFRERPFNEPNSRSLKPPGIDSSPRNHVAQPPPYHGHGRDGERRSPLLSHPPFHHWDERGNEHHEREHERGDRGRDPKGGMYDKSGIYNNNNNNNHMGMPPGPGQQPHMPFCPPYGMDMGEHNMRGGPMGSYDMFPDPGHRMGMYGGPMGPQHQPIGVGPPPPPQMHGMGSFNNMYNPIPPRPTMGFNRFPPMMRPSYPNARLGFMPMRGHMGEPRHMMPPNNLASVYQGVAAKVGTGIIDDPLEAFNRIMKEKEKRKEERRRSPDRRRSRSNDRQMRGTRFRSPMYDRGNQRGNRDMNRSEMREKRGRSRDRDVRRDRFRDRSDHDWEKGNYRHRRSNSFSDRGSRSRSRSNSMTKMSRSPNHMHRRSRSRPRSFVDKPRPDERDRSNGRSEPKHLDMQPRFSSRERSLSRLQDEWDMQGSQNPNDFRENSKPRDECSFNQPLTPTRKRELSVENRSKMMDEPPPPGFEGMPPSNMSDWNMSNERQYQHSPPYGMDQQPPMGPNDRDMHRERDRERDRERNDREKQWERDHQNKDRVKEVPVRERERDRERVKERDVDKDRHRGERDKEREREKDKNREKDDKERVREKDREKLRDSEREKEKQRERERNKERPRERDREKEREGDREREKNKEKEKIRDREKEKERERERARDKDRERVKDMDRERERDREREKERESEREKERERETRDKHNERGREREREREKPRRSASHEKNILPLKNQDRDRYTHRPYDREGREFENSKDRNHDNGLNNKNKTNENESTNKGQIRKVNPFAVREPEAVRATSDDEKHNKDRKKRKKDKNERRKSRKLKKEKRSRSKHKDNSKDNIGSDHENDAESEHEMGKMDDDKKHMSPQMKTPEERNSLNSLKNTDLNLKITFSVNKREEDAKISDADEERHVSTADNMPITISAATTITTTATSTATTTENTQIPEQINDLYADICEEGELLEEEKKSTLLEREESALNEQIPIDLNQSKTLKHFDSVLDIHDYEIDFDELQNPLKSKVATALPEISKWEREDQHTSMNISGGVGGSIIDNKLKGIENGKEKVTNEILRKAENAIFTRAINAIRPAEMNHTSVEKSTQRRGTSVDQHATNVTPASTIINKNESANAKDMIRSAAIKTFQITVPASTQERSVEIRGGGGGGGDKKKSNSPRQIRGSVKERLGRKIVNKSFSPTTTREFQSRSKRSHSQERVNFSGRNDKKRRVEDISNRSSGGPGGHNRGFRGNNNNHNNNNNNSGNNRRYNNDGNDNNNRKSRDYSLERNNKDKRDSQRGRERERDYSAERYKSQQKKSVNERLDINHDKEKHRDIKARNNRDSRSKSTENDNDVDDDDDDDATDTDDSKRKRNKRNKRDKKDKKRAKRSSSEESNNNNNNDNDNDGDDDSGGDKRGKHLKGKKRNKSERKKKKNKK